MKRRHVIFAGKISSPVAYRRSALIKQRFISAIFHPYEHYQAEFIMREDCGLLQELVIE